MSDTDAVRMSAAELRCVMDFLGFSFGTLAAALDVDERVVRRWMQGPTPTRTNRIPDWAVEKMDALEERTERVLDELVVSLDPDEPQEVVVYRSDEDLRAARPEFAGLPARWWRHVVMRAACEVPVVVVFGE